MAESANRSSTGFAPVRTESDQLIASSDVAERIVNMQDTREGTLRSIAGPAPYEVYHESPPVGQVVGNPYVYPGRMHGLVHAKIKNGTRELLLAHSGDAIIEHQGWNRAWANLIVSGGTRASANIIDDRRPRYPTQFVVAPNGIVIIPQDTPAFFYDGDLIAPLGYSEVPSPPKGHGPTTTFNVAEGSWFGTIANGDNSRGINGTGYAHDGVRGTPTGMDPDFGVGRLGTVERNPGANPASLDDASGSSSDKRDIVHAGSTGMLLDGCYRAAMQWIDAWGNLSPVSGRSEPVTFKPEKAKWWDPDATGTAKWKDAPLDFMTKQVLWTGISAGREGTIGRILCRTKDLNHAGTADLFEVPSHSAEGVSIATIQDNIAEVWPDNAPDSWLIRTPVDVAPMTRFALGALWDGRFWAARFYQDEGKIHPSLPGRWGTLERDWDMYPDPRASGITGLCAAPSGLLAFTENGIYQIRRADDSSGRYVSDTISSRVGCVAPNSIQTTATGAVLWLGRDGFYQMNADGEISRISDDIAEICDRVNRVRAGMAVACIDPATGVYCCWVPVDGALEPNLGLIYNGVGWKERTDMDTVAAVCVVDGHGQKILAAGQSTGKNDVHASPETQRHGVWVLDHKVSCYTPADRTAMIESSWANAQNPDARTSARTLKLWLRETVQEGLKVQVFRDWRRTTASMTQLPTAKVPTRMWPADNAPPFWGEAVYGDGSAFVRRRPFVTRLDIAAPSCEVFKVRIETESAWELLAFALEDNPKAPGGARTPP